MVFWAVVRSSMATLISSRSCLMVLNWSGWLLSPTSRSFVLARNGSVMSAGVATACQRLHIAMASELRMTRRCTRGADVEADADADMVVNRGRGQGLRSVKTGHAT